MKKIYLILFFLFVFTNYSFAKILEIKANPDKGFYFPYLLETSNKNNEKVSNVKFETPKKEKHEITDNFVKASKSFIKENIE